MSIVTSDGGLTSAGYAIFLILAIALISVAGISEKNKQGKTLSSKQLVCCGTAIALAFAASYIRLWEMPFGGSVTLFSMLFICLIGYWYGPRTGIITGLAYGILQFIQKPYVLNPLQVCCDYLFGFAALGLSGFFWKSKYGLIKGYILGVVARGAFHALGGYLFWMSYLPESFPSSLAGIYPIVYNYSYLLAEGILTLVVLSLAPVRKAMNQIKQLVTE